MMVAGLLMACNPEAPWETKKVEIRMNVETVSAGYVECSFSTNKEAYYLIAIEECREGYDPMENQKQFMTLALDKAQVDYIAWREELLEQGEFNIAPFSSHSLQYGTATHFFTGLFPGIDYWIYAFVVNPETMSPAGTLNLVRVTTTAESVVDIHFHYRVKGIWDYAYPLDAQGNINSRFPYIATTRDSIELAEDEYWDGDPVYYFRLWMLDQFADPEHANVFYGVKAMENDGSESHAIFENGHMYYTAIGGYDGNFKQLAIYKFTWQGAETDLYFRDTDSANLVTP